jgi:ribonuclease P protein component
MEKKNMITDNKDYRIVYNRGKSLSDYNLVLFVRKRRDKKLRFGITTAKKMKRAVDRNKFRRRIKEIIRKHFDSVETGYDIVIMGRLNGKDADFSKLEKSYTKLLKKSIIWKKEK